MSKTKRYAEDLLGEDGFQEYLSKEMEKDDDRRK